MAALVVNTNGVHFADAVDSEYVIVRDDVDVQAIIGDMLGDDTTSLDAATVKRTSVASLAAIADATFAYLSAQENGNMEGVYERVELRGLLEKAGYPSLTELDT